MPGLYGVVAQPHALGLKELAEAMQQRMLHHAWYRVDEHVDEAAGIALGRISLGFIQGQPQPKWSQDRQVCLMMDGEVFNGAELVQTLGISGVDLFDHSAIVLEGYLREGRRFFGRLNATFVAAIWDNANNQLILASDRFGMKPLYYALSNGKFLFAGEIKSILADPTVSRKLHQRGIAQFFSFGQHFCEDTFFTAIRTLPSASWVTYDRNENKLEVDQYWRESDTRLPAIGSHAEFIDRIDSAFARAVETRSTGSDSLGISLSGGLDSRTILALVPKSTPVKCISMGMPGSLDHECAEQMAKLAGREHFRSYLDQQFLANYEHHLRHMVHLTDGHYLDQGIVVPTLPKYRELGIEVLLRGHAGELLHMDKAYNFSLDTVGWTIDNEPSLREWLQAHLGCYILAGLPGQLFKSMTADDVQQHADSSLDEALAESVDFSDPLNRIWQMFISQRLRRETSMSMAKIGTYMETRLPFLDKDLVEALLAGRPEWKKGDAIQIEMLRRRFPQFLGVVNANTGAPMGAGALRRKFATLRMKVLGKLGVPGYQPYERLGLWLRRELRPMVEDLVLSDRTLDRGVFEPDTARQVAENHFQRRQNHTALLLAMLIFELGQREFVDGESFVGNPSPQLASN